MIVARTTQVPKEVLTEERLIKTGTTDALVNPHSEAREMGLSIDEEVSTNLWELLGQAQNRLESVPELTAEAQEAQALTEEEKEILMIPTTPWV